MFVWSCHGGYVAGRNSPAGTAMTDRDCVWRRMRVLSLHIDWWFFVLCLRNQIIVKIVCIYQNIVNVVVIFHLKKGTMKFLRVFFLHGRREVANERMRCIAYQPMRERVASSNGQWRGVLHSGSASALCEAGEGAAHTFSVLWCPLLMTIRDL